MVAALHRAGLGVVMDVVYNHTYHGESNLERTVPGYWNRRWPNGHDDQRLRLRLRPGQRAARWCGNTWWSRCCTGPQTYHIDGFRFDLMALEDADTMNAIRAALDSSARRARSILLYGEPWHGRRHEP